MIKKYLFSAIMVAGLVFQSCSKDDDDNSSSMTTIEKLCNEGWIIDNVKMTMNNVEQDMTDIMFDACALDNVTTYDVDNTLTMDEAADVCVDAVQNLDGAWSLSDDESTLSVTMDGMTEEFTIDAISSSSITLSTEISMGGLVAKTEIKFKH